MADFCTNLCALETPVTMLPQLVFRQKPPLFSTVAPLFGLALASLGTILAYV
jgi:hypothetical protein